MIEVCARVGGRRQEFRCFDEDASGTTRRDYPRYHFGIDEELFGRSAVARDLLQIALAVHLADRLVRRNRSSGHRQRKFAVAISLENPGLWNPQRTLLEELAAFSTADEWHFTFRRAKVIGREPVPARIRSVLAAPTIVALFSGGLDSLCGAAFLARRGERPAFVVHSPPGRDKAYTLLSATFESLGQPAPRPQHVVTFAIRPRQRDHKGVRTFYQEATRRSRPFLFLALASATALAFGVRRVQMSENGALGLSLPLRRSHYGPRMTRQAHSFLLDGFRRVLAGVAPHGEPWSLENPFVDSTKGEACEQLGNAAKFAAETLSCEYGGQQVARLRRWERQQHRSPRVRQCGLCVPCIVRRAALKRAGIRDDNDAYTFSATKTLRAALRGVDQFAKLVPRRRPPLYEFVRAHPLYAARFAKEIATMRVDQFAVQYLPELNAVRPPITDARRMRSVFVVQQRFAAELMRFLDV